MVAFVARVVIWALRANQAKTPSEDLSKNLTIYWQISFIVGHTSTYFAVVNLLRCLYVGTTKGSTPSRQIRLGSSDHNSQEPPEPTVTELPTVGHTPPEGEDRPRIRFWYRRAFDMLVLVGFTPLIVGLVMGFAYVKAETNAKKASYVQTMR